MGTFPKPVGTREQAEAEVKGWTRLASRISVPALHGEVALPDRRLLAYEDVFATGRCEVLMGDVIALADRDPAVLPRLDRLVDGVCADLRAAAEETGKRVPLADCVPDLYLDRIRPGGRLDRWYLRRDLPIALPHTHMTVTLRELADYTITANGRRLTLNVADTIDSLRHSLAPDRLWLAGLTQGDTTEPNIADPLCWLDFEFAGRNTAAGEAANLIWYLMALGGWLVPRYQPDVYARSLRLALPPLTRPRIEHLELNEGRRHIDVRYFWDTGPGRSAAVTRALGGLRGEGGSGLEEIRAFLALRILGVIPASRLTGHDLLLVLINLAESQDPLTAIGTFFTTTQAPHRNSGERSSNVPAPA
ncbi:hypothetical protein Snoj_16430 [Streptomyces nojiriensis]|uniref:Uncharacterized protein n=1 Tax=Streptomyces nojiriensis TaxID=66374 RepID=A0ABQ3SIM5_9ACTN|nr:hypothetical protein GCM10010205_43600 [Streptomyces nojiriensis]GHI67725.1 hypothetical protein Snoj_16430 [Streptomyces nojiriensis]